MPLTTSQITIINERINRQLERYAGNTQIPELLGRLQIMLDESQEMTNDDPRKEKYQRLVQSILLDIENV